MEITKFIKVDERYNKKGNMIKILEEYHYQNTCIYRYNTHSLSRLKQSKGVRFHNKETSN